ncbi:PAS domain-containing protein [Stigmatella ashevillensis]|uniref:PAS domain-containing protein n=1 Tax=Stigmatella ashevillensis TaxID=2995309 RepID=UPI0040329203
MFAFEVTDQLQARQEVELSREEARRSAAQLQAITDTLPALVAYLDLAERYLFANQAYESWFGVKPEDVLGKTAAEFVGAEASAWGWGSTSPAPSWSCSAAPSACRANPAKARPSPWTCPGNRPQARPARADLPID